MGLKRFAQVGTDEKPRKSGRPLEGAALQPFLPHSAGQRGSARSSLECPGKHPLSPSPGGLRSLSRLSEWERFPARSPHFQYCLIPSHYFC